MTTVIKNTPPHKTKKKKKNQLRKQPLRQIAMRRQPPRGAN